MTSTKDRSALHAYLGEEAHEAWQTFADENGVSVTALLEDLGLTLSKEMAAANTAIIRPEWTKGARAIDAGRRRRKPVSTGG